MPRVGSLQAGQGKAIAPLPKLEDEVTEALMREQAKLRAHTSMLRDEIGTKMTKLQPFIDNASKFS